MVFRLTEQASTAQTPPRGKAMKTKTASSRLMLLGIAIAAALLTQPVRATAINTLVITENSSTSLTATLNGNPLTVTFHISNDWTIALAGVSGFAQTGRSQTLRALLTS
jgi:hypothetical protein